MRFLLEFNDFEVVLSRTKDEACGGAVNVTDDVNNQIKFGNSCGADACVAIHYNSSTNKSAHGVEALYSEYNGLAAKNIRLATLLSSNVAAFTGLTERNLVNSEKAVGVVRAIQKPVALIECAFVSNDAESIFCYDWSHQFLIARGIVKACCEYFGKEYIDMDKTTVKVNGKTIGVGYLINNSNYTPVRALAEALGATVSWDAKNKTVNITK